MNETTMRVKVGDRFRIGTGWEAWYRQENGTFMPLFEDGQECRIEGWWNLEGERVFKVHSIDGGIGCDAFPAQYIDLIGTRR